MSDSIPIVLCVLWEDELREAARLLTAMSSASKEDFPEKARDAMNACLVALHSLTDEKHVVMIGAGAVRQQMLGKLKKQKK